jgi:leader peptidase (prepilin peptidase)/N-methyltransferase
MTPLAIALGVAGAAWGAASDRISVRWPEHDEEFVAGRPVGWRTAVVTVLGAVVLGAIGARFEGRPELLVFGAYAVALILLLAVDLDQRLLPDLITLPMIPLALLYAVSGRNPFVGGALVPAVIVAIVIPLALYLPSLLFGAGAFGLGDVKLLVSLGLVSGFDRALIGVFAGVLLAGVVILVLIASRRIGRKSYVPFGPFIIIGAFWVLFVARA